MVAPTDSASEYDEVAPELMAMKIQKRIAKLKNERDEHMNAVLGEVEEALGELRSRVVAIQEERRNQELQVYAALVQSLMDAIERRKDIETKMTEMTKKLYLHTTELEQMMLKGYDGREEDLKKFIG